MSYAYICICTKVSAFNLADTVFDDQNQNKVNSFWESTTHKNFFNF